MTLHDLLKAICFYNYSVSVRVLPNKGLNPDIGLHARGSLATGREEGQVLILRLLHFGEIPSIWEQEDKGIFWIEI